MPRGKFPAFESPPEVTYRATHDELMIDGNARLNLDRPVHTSETASSFRH